MKRKNFTHSIESQSSLKKVNSCAVNQLDQLSTQSQFSQYLDIASIPHYNPSHLDYAGTIIAETGLITIEACNKTQNMSRDGSCSDTANAESSTDCEMTELSVTTSPKSHRRQNLFDYFSGTTKKISPFFRESQVITSTNIAKFKEEPMECDVVCKVCSVNIGETSQVQKCNYCTSIVCDAKCDSICDTCGLVYCRLCSNISYKTSYETMACPDCQCAL